ncbi:MAG: hypothetical protein R3F59_24215 [Myxococcota bacterium]
MAQHAQRQAAHLQLLRHRRHPDHAADRTDVNPSDTLGLDAGIEGTHQLTASPPKQILGWDSPTTWWLGAGWAEGTVRTPPVNVTLGARYDASTVYEDAVSPRLVLARAWRRWHYKAGASRAFRAPGVAAASPWVVPEKTTAFDGELGVGPTAWSYLTLSAFDNQLFDPMVYHYEYDPETHEEFEGYRNGDPLHTAGGDATLQILSGEVQASLGVGTTAVVGSAPPDWAVPGAPSRTLSMPQWKAVARGSWTPTERWHFGGVVTWMGDRWTVSAQDADGNAVYDTVPASVVLDLSAEVHHVFVRGLSLSANVHDLLDSAPPLVQPYTGFHLPMPTAGRDVMFRVTVER